MLCCSQSSATLALLPPIPRPLGPVSAGLFRVRAGKLGAMNGKHNRYQSSSVIGTLRRRVAWCSERVVVCSCLLSTLAGLALISLFPLWSASAVMFPACIVAVIVGLASSATLLFFRDAFGLQLLGLCALIANAFSALVLSCILLIVISMVHPSNG